MTSAELLVDAYARIDDLVHEVADDISEEAWSYRPDPEANTIAWLLWHLTRIRDDHLCEVMGEQQIWIAGRWRSRCSLPFEEEATGYGQSSEETAALTSLDPEFVIGYYDAVSNATRPFLESLTDADLDRVVDRRWNPPVTLGVRLVSVISDCLQHGGQAAYLRGVADRHHGA